MKAPLGRVVENVALERPAKAASPADEPFVLYAPLAAVAPPLAQPSEIPLWNETILVSLVSILIFLSACLPARAVAGLSVEGMNQNSVTKVGGLYLTRSEVLTEGKASSIRLARRVTCADQRVRLLASEAFDSESADAICATASKALAFSVNQSGGQRASVEIRVVPPRVSYHDTSWRIGRFPKLVLIVPDLTDRHATLANVADLVAHEVFHVVMNAAGDVVLGTDEYMAYHFGLCGQLVAIGEIAPSSMPGFALASSDPDVVSSSSAAERVRDELKSQAHGASIAVDTPFGQELLNRCRSIGPGTHGALTRTTSGS
ncbi:MAG TPA: hypothetical protein VD865_00475 [Stenotrophomonas sp.]|nr:hypothetical protein [Stenotrophomonas sp.]